MKQDDFTLEFRVDLTTFNYYEIKNLKSLQRHLALYHKMFLVWMMMIQQGIAQSILVYLIYIIYLGVISSGENYVCGVTLRLRVYEYES